MAEEGVLRSEVGLTSGMFQISYFAISGQQFFLAGSFWILSELVAVLLLAHSAALITIGAVFY